MRLKKQHSNYIARKITTDLAKSEFIEIRKDRQAIIQEIEKILLEDIYNELELEEEVREVLEDYEEDIEFYNADWKELFKLTKKKLAPEFDVILNLDERVSNLAHNIMDYLYEEDFIHFEVNDMKVKTLIYESIMDFLKGFEEADIATIEKIKNYKRKLIPGTEEYDLVYARMYEGELKKRGLA
jgi:hypothetical protein